MSTKSTNMNVSKGLRERRAVWLKASALWLFLGALLMARPSAAQGDRFVVTNNGDGGVDGCTTANVGDGCSLREAVAAANANASPSAISFANSVRGVIQLGSSLPDLEGSLGVQGPGAASLTVRAGASGRIFTNRGDATVRGLTFAGGSSDESGGAILNDGFLFLERCVLSDNRSGASGGALFNTRSLLLNLCTFNGNSALEGGALANVGGAADAVVAASTFNNNRAVGDFDDSTVSGLGGAISSRAQTSDGAQASLEILRCTFRDNRASDGGGIYHEGGLLVEGSTFLNNFAGGGAGLTHAKGTALVQNSTFSANVATGTLSGSGIYSGNFPGTEPTVLTVRSCTFNENEGVFGKSIGAVSGRVVLGNNIFRLNPNKETEYSLASTSDVMFESEGYNLNANNDSFGLLTAPTDRSNTDPRLGPLADNGGPTQTHALLPDSPALDQGNSSLRVDQRGRVRPFDSGFAPRLGGNRADIGAFENGSIVNRAPFARADVYSTENNTAFQVAAPGVLGNDSDADGDALRAVLVQGPAQAREFVLARNGDFFYAPNPDFAGEDAFTYAASDGKSQSRTVRVTIRVGEPPLPVASVRTDILTRESFSFPGENVPVEAVVIVSLSEPAPRDVFVDFRTQDGSAKANLDYTPRSGTLRIVKGRSGGEVRVRLVNDNVREADENFAVVLSNPRNATLGNARAVVTIQNDDSAADLSVEQSFLPSQVAPNGRATLRVRLTNNGPDPVPSVTATALLPSNVTSYSSDITIPPPSPNDPPRPDGRTPIVLIPSSPLGVKESALIDVFLTFGPTRGTFFSDVSVQGRFFGGDVVDPNPANNSAQSTILVSGPLDVTPQVRVQIGKFRPSGGYTPGVYGKSRKHTGTVTLTNISNEPIPGPLLLDVRDLSSGVELLNPSGVFDGTTSSPFVLVSPGRDNVFSPNERLRVKLTFRVPRGKSVRFSPFVISDPDSASPARKR